MKCKHCGLCEEDHSGFWKLSNCKFETIEEDVNGEKEVKQ